MIILIINPFLEKYIYLILYFSLRFNLSPCLTLFFLNIHFLHFLSIFLVNVGVFLIRDDIALVFQFPSLLHG